MSVLDWILNRWEYGTLASGLRARRRVRTGHVEYLLHARGEHGRPDDFWYPPHTDHWPSFIADRTASTDGGGA